MDKIIKEKTSKVDFRALFTNISYAAEPIQTLYPVDLSQPFSISEAASTLKSTICYVENLQYSDLFDQSKVDLYHVDLNILPNLDLHRNYIINIVTGMLYYIDGEPYKGLIYHTPRYGVKQEKPAITITLDANGGYFDEDNVKENLLINYEMSNSDKLQITKTDGEAFGSELLIEPISSSNYRFVGWFTEKKKGQQKFVGNSYNAEELSKNTLYAHWEENTAPSDSDLTIHYLSSDAELGYTETSYTQTVLATSTDSATLDKCKFTGPGAGYTFLGWKNLLTANASISYQQGGYYDVANLLTKVFDQGWQGEILDIIQSYEDWESDEEPEETDEDLSDVEPEESMEEQRRAEILEYFEGEETSIQALFTSSSMTLNELADWMVENQEYLAKLQEYEENLDENHDDEILTVDYFDQQSGINMNGKDLWLEAVWTNLNGITLDANGGTIDGLARITAQIEAGDEYGDVLYDPDDRENYIFVGWFTAATGGEQITDDRTFQTTDSKILYAHWVPDNDSNVVSITYHANTGKLFDNEGNELDTITVSKVKNTKFGTMPVPEKTSFIFDGWFTSATGGTQVVASSVVTGSMELYAHWTESKFVKLDLQGGEVYTTKAKAWQRKSYYKWNPYIYYTQSNRAYSGINVEDGKAIGYQAKGYMVCNKKNKGWQLPTGKNLYAKTVTSGAAYRGVRLVTYDTKLNGKSYKKKVNFLGWYTKPNGEGSLIQPQDIWDASKIENPSDPTLYAYWQEALTITYDANGGYFGKVSQNVTKKQFYNKVEGKKYPKIARPKRDGYAFLGWYDAPAGGNQILPNNVTCLMRRDAQTVYAHWEKVEIAVSVSDVTTNGWTQSLTSASNDLSNYKVRFRWSTKLPNAKKNNGYVTSNTVVTKKKEGKTYYVWGYVVSKNGEKVFSKNYVEVQTSHPTHKGSTSSGGECYKDYDICTNNTYYYKIGGAGNYPNQLLYVSNSDRYCCVCAATCGSGYKAAKNGKFIGAMGINAICAVCGATAYTTQGKNIGTFVCQNHASCWTYGSPRWTINGHSYNSWNNCLYTPTPIVSNGYAYGCTSSSSRDVQVYHNKIYKLTCSRPVNGSATSVNF